jgi:hypothetical protein
VNFFYILLPAVLLVACVGTPKPLQVKQFHLRTDTVISTDEPMIRMEVQRRLHGAITQEERRQRLGQYFTLRWHDPAGAGKGEVEIIFEYQQGATASLVKRLSKTFPSADAGGSVEFAVIGDDYFTQGKVLTWKASLLRDKRVLSTRQSYLWQ